MFYVLRFTFAFHVLRSQFTFYLIPHTSYLLPLTYSGHPYIQCIATTFVVNKPCTIAGYADPGVLITVYRESELLLSGAIGFDPVNAIDGRFHG